MTQPAKSAAPTGSLPVQPSPEVYCFGHVTSGVILRLKGSYPAADGYGEIVESLENHCGEATGSALVLARFGAKVAIEGNWIGDNPECRRTLSFLQSRGIDCSGLVVQPGYRGVTETVVSDGHSRTVFGRYCDLLFTTPQWPAPSLERIRSARVVCVDPAFGETTLLVARTATEAGLPLITSDAPLNSPLAELASVNVVSDELIRREYPEAVKAESNRRALFADYARRSRGLLVFTSGSRPLWYARTGDTSVREMAPFKVDVIDSAGAGDSFRGALAYSVLRGWSDEMSLRFASAVAALVCTTAPGCVNSPTLEQVEQFLRDHETPAVHR